MVELAMVRTETTLSLLDFMCPPSVNKDTFLILKLHRRYTEYCITRRK